MLRSRLAYFRIGLSVGVSLSAAIALPALGAESLQFKQALEYALQHSPELDSASRELNASELERKSGISRFLPSLDLAATHGLEDERPSFGDSPWESDLTLSLTETLWDNGVSLTRYRIARVGNEQAGIRFRQTRDRILRDVGSEFFRYSLTLKLLEIRQSQFDLLKKQYELTSQQYHQGLKTRRDFLRFKTELGRAEIDMLNARNTVTRSEQELKRLLSVPLGSATAPLSFVPEESLPALDRLPRQAPKLESHATYRLAELERETQSLEASLLTRRYWPELTLSSGVTYRATDYLGQNDVTVANDQLGWNALLTLRYNLWDWGIRRRDRTVAEERRRIQSNELETELLSLRSEIERLMLSLEQFRSNFKLSQELLKLEQDNMRLLETEYRNGKVSYLDYINSLENLADARIKYYSALYELKQGLLAHGYHEGTLYESIFPEK